MISLLHLTFALAKLNLQGQDDILLADFEGQDYGVWQVTGSAFGASPAKGTLANQMPVTGFRGKGLVNSYLGGDGATGTLTSPPFRITRRYLRFLIGGGRDFERTAMRLLVNGRLVRRATGSNDRPGGSEALEQDYWNVSELQGQIAVIQIVDFATGGWGHINVDEIAMTNTKPVGIKTGATREITLEKSFLNLPIKQGGTKRKMTVRIEGQPERVFDIELADDAPDWRALMDIAPFRGRKATIIVDKLPEGSHGLSAIDQSDAIHNADTLYQEKLRPQFHFSPRRGWNNDPNGLIYYKGEYHLFFQHNPYGWDWGNMHWGHAVSADLIHWKELPIALYPDQHGTMYSGSAVVDTHNTAGFQNGSEPPLISIFTAAGNPFTQGIAYSNDRGRTWTKYAKNPVLPHIAGENRDPKVFWYAPEQKWVMALYLEKDDFGLFSSKNLKQWEKMSLVTIPGTTECPEFFEIALDGDSRKKRWVFYGGNGGYLIGQFDGATFTPESGPHRLQSGNCWYASQTFNNIPQQDGRRILIPWGTMATPKMPFNQMMGLPVTLTLHTTEEGARLFANPVVEIESLRLASQSLPAQPLKAGENPLGNLQGELLDITTEITLREAQAIDFNLRGIAVHYNAQTHEISCLDRKAILKPIGGKIQLRFLVDRTSLDIFGNGGRLYMPMGVIASAENRSLALSAQGGNAYLNSLKVHQLKSAWTPAK